MSQAQTPPPILNIQMTPAGIELVIASLRKLPHEQVNDLVQELWVQYKTQMQQLAEANMNAPAEDAKEPTTEDGAAD